ncbi:uncharacterized protein T551_01935 [Pneumocystis jirovecii RU7]|uniref:Uncharacterized protein n=1 Tax=Pneumocystis jirovecii (strain RU7) TaxID=1408657 RepID=A0A0W4ZNN7_PNEJ7|nr:uncharacterized protein T551_01935 [Pneumocystis jirovecii RU7]KTW29991.1 hypothetical protein T551_01935 [Pneumocystis jirovecii RU7]
MRPGKDIVEEVDIDEHCAVEFSNLNKIEKKGLGHYSLTSCKVVLSVLGKQITVRQNPNMLYSHKGETGSIVWRASVVCLEYLLSQEWFIDDLENYQVVELGTGISGIAAIMLGDRVDKYIATDMEHILKYLDKNIHENIISKPDVKRKQPGIKKTNMSIMELNWAEHPKTYLKNLRDLLNGSSKNLCILAFDTIYNPHVTTHFVNTLISIFKHFYQEYEDLVAIICQELRCYDTLYDFLEKMQSSFYIQTILDQQLQKGYQIYIARLRQ